MTKCGDPGCDYCGDDRLEYTTREYDRVVAERERLLAALKKYGWHTDECATVNGWHTRSMPECDCGLSEALEPKTQP